jgi:hypothetical protein
MVPYCPRVLGGGGPVDERDDSRPVVWHYTEDGEPETTLLAKKHEILLERPATRQIWYPGANQRESALAASRGAQLPVPAKPLDWLQTTCPRRWHFGTEVFCYDWSDVTGTGFARPA